MDSFLIDVVEFGHFFWLGYVCSCRFRPASDLVAGAVLLVSLRLLAGMVEGTDFYYLNGSLRFLRFQWVLVCRLVGWWLLLFFFSLVSDWLVGGSVDAG